MPVTFQSITDRAIRLANGIATDAHDAPTIDAAYLTEDLLITALREAVSRSNFRRGYTLTLAGGKVALPSGIILEKMNTATIENGTDAGTPTSFESRFFDFKRAPSDLLNYACISGNEFYFREAGTDADAFDGEVDLTVCALPDLSASVTDEIELPDTVAEEASRILARLMRGE